MKEEKSNYLVGPDPLCSPEPEPEPEPEAPPDLTFCVHEKQAQLQVKRLRQGKQATEEGFAGSDDIQKLRVCPQSSAYVLLCPT